MIGQEAGKSFAYVLGVYLGDGAVTTWRGKGRSDRLVFRLNTIDEDFAQATKVALQSLSKFAVGVWSHPVSRSSKPNWALQCGDRDLCETLVAITNHKKSIPVEVLTRYPRDEKLAFIAGLMDSEGFVAEQRQRPGSKRFYMGFKSCDVWFDDFVRILNSVDIEIGKIGVEKPRRAGFKTPRRFTIKMRSWVDSGAYFNIARKQRRVDEWATELTPETNTHST